MTPATGTALVVLVAFVLPGFVVVLFQERTFKRAEQVTPFDRLLRVAYYSVWCYLLLAIVALIFGIDRPYLERLFMRYETDPAHLVWRGAVVVLAPAAVVWLATLLTHELGLNRRAVEAVRLNARHLEPTAWDFWFRKGLKSHLRIMFADGRSVWGFYGQRSFASYSKDGRDLFLEHIYGERVIDDDGSDDAPGPWFGSSHDANRGGWVNLSDAVCIEIYDFDHGQAASQANTATQRRSWARAGGRAAADEPPSGDANAASDASSAAQEDLTTADARNAAATSSKRDILSRPGFDGDLEARMASWQKGMLPTRWPDRRSTPMS